MFIPRLSRSQIKKMRAAGSSAARTLHQACAQLGVGVTGAQIDAAVRRHTATEGGTPAQLGYHGFPGSLCISPNQVVCHGIPSPTRFEDGDIVNLDITTCLRGFHGDTSRTVAIGTPSEEASALMALAESCMWAGIAQIRDGVELGRVGEAIEALATRHGCSVVREFGGHGIGRKMHLPPHVHHHAGTGGPILRSGMCITVEPMINQGSAQVVMDPDEWTVRTADGSLSAQFEHTLLVTDSGCEVLTLASAL